jgi:hypothetical protein
MKYFLFNSVVVYLCLILLSYPALGALPETGSLVPAETMVLVNINDFSKAKANFEKTDIYGLYKDPAMKAFFEDAREKLDQKVREEKSKVLEFFINNEIMPEGKVFLALVLSEKALKDNEPQALFLVQFGSGIEQVKELLTDIVSQAVDEGAREQQEDYRGVNLKTVTKENERFEYGFSSSIS